MEEREALKKQIELLQNLINTHKSVHGDIPLSASQWHASRQEVGLSQGHNPPAAPQSFPVRPQPYVSHTGQWRKKYSLSNKGSRADREEPSHSHPPKQPAFLRPGSGSLVGSTNLTQNDQSQARGELGKEGSQKCTAEPSLSQARDRDKGRMDSDKEEMTRTAVNKAGIKIGPRKEAVSGQRTSSSTISSVSVGSQQRRVTKSLQPASDGATAILCTTSVGETSFLVKKETATHNQLKPHISGNDSLVSKRLVTTAAVTRDSSHITSPNAALHPKIKPDVPPQPHISSLPQKKSQFTWVKSQEARELKHPTHGEAPHPRSSPSTSTAPHPEVTSTRRAPGSTKKVPRRPSLSAGASKTSKYTWVSSSPSAMSVSKVVTSSKLPRKPLSPRAVKVSPKAPLEAARKLKPASQTSVKPRRVSGATGGAPTSCLSPVSRYCWKAAGQNLPGAGTGSSTRSAYRWTSEKENGPKGAKGGTPPLSARIPAASSPSPGAYKLRSRMKIIRRSASSSPVSDRRLSPGLVTLRSRYSLRRRTPPPVRLAGAGRRTQARALVSFGRHKLRRLSPSSSPHSLTRAGSSSWVCSPVGQRVIKTRYKIDARRRDASTTPTHHLSPALSYRVRRIQSARTLLQSRLRSPPEPSWRGRNIRWIRGTLYQVSANKLSRTLTTSSPSNKTAKWYSPQESPIHLPIRASSTRNVASRAVQRSLAIIRQANQKKQQARHYCMYYNRFGKCNRGNACPYIHDPDKVAVCTRFLRGTCKQTDGTCPFSHKVSKEKMPVCSYFLKGICNNSSCPYSHVYVSRKAAVCQDFIRGYCPQGEKCKKKHTLVCPDFSSSGQCPHGTKCKLQHRTPLKRTGTPPCTGPIKRARSRDGTKRSEQTSVPSADPPQSSRAAERTPLPAPEGPEKLPSFISLSSSPETLDSGHAPDTPVTAVPQPTGKTLHIKPRF